MENIEELINVMMEFEKGEEEVSLETFLDKVSLVSDVDLYEDKGNRVSLMTLHCAKGLEFPYVFITGIGRRASAPSSKGRRDSRISKRREGSSMWG